MLCGNYKSNIYSNYCDIGKTDFGCNGDTLNCRKVGYCKECANALYERDRIPKRRIWECCECGHPHAEGEWDIDG
jgi:hypothetical protein